MVFNYLKKKTTFNKRNNFLLLKLALSNYYIETGFYLKLILCLQYFLINMHIF